MTKPTAGVCFPQRGSSGSQATIFAQPPPAKGTQDGLFLLQQKNLSLRRQRQRKAHQEAAIHPQAAPAHLAVIAMGLVAADTVLHQAEISVTDKIVMSPSIEGLKL